MGTFNNNKLDKTMNFLCKEGNKVLDKYIYKGKLTNELKVNIKKVTRKTVKEKRSLVTEFNREIYNLRKENLKPEQYYFEKYKILEKYKEKGLELKIVHRHRLHYVLVESGLHTIN